MEGMVGREMQELVGIGPESHLLSPCLLQPHTQRGMMAKKIKDIKECLQPFSDVLGGEILAYIIVFLVCLVITCWLCGYPQKIIKKIKQTLGKQSCTEKENSRIILVSLY